MSGIEEIEEIEGIEGIEEVEEVEGFEELAPNPKLSKHLNIKPLNP